MIRPVGDLTTVEKGGGCSLGQGISRLGGEYHVLTGMGFLVFQLSLCRIPKGSLHTVGQIIIESTADLKDVSRRFLIMRYNRRFFMVLAEQSFKEKALDKGGHTLLSGLGYQKSDRFVLIPTGPDPAI